MFPLGFVFRESPAAVQLASVSLANQADRHRDQQPQILTWLRYVATWISSLVLCGPS